eukprot:GEMP01049678.1.p1 GENE.GEMP01049678.1~~GEMP01049678.1.p1  ORF type:complete len:230 (+),score=32.68 GEMP01049678.1:67-756(+)
MMCLALLVVIVGSTPNAMVYLDDNTFESTTKLLTGMSAGPWLVFFYVPLCEPCRKALVSGSKFATNVRGQINVAAVDVTANKGLEQQFRIETYPTIYFFSNQEQYKYVGSRTVAAYKEFVTEGFKQQHGGPIATPPTFFTKAIDKLGLPVFVLLVVLCAILLIGSVVLCVIWRVSRPGTSRLAMKKKSDGTGDTPVNMNTDTPVNPNADMPTHTDAHLGGVEPDAHPEV